jgi:deazaflavin-dependent oxidoreductase (nitroreductase family)
VPLPRSIGQFNKRYANHVTRPFAARLPGLGVVVHVGRRSGRTYHTPVLAFRRATGYEFALPYGQGDWVKNVVHRGGASLATRGHRYLLTNPRVVEDREHRGLPVPVRAILQRIGADEVLLADLAGSGDTT